MMFIDIDMNVIWDLLPQSLSVYGVNTDLTENFLLEYNDRVYY